ncbi:MAG: HAMP domain-containing sensor histidine kinase [Anaerolineae bacterium]
MSLDHEIANYMIQHSADGVLITNANGVLETVNPAAASLLMTASQDLIGHMPLDVFGKNAALMALFTRTGEVNLDVKLNKKRIAQGSALSMADQRRMVILHDVTEQRDLDSRREALVGSIAHDLRNPLSVVYTYLDMVITSEGLDDDQRAQLGQARSMTVRLHDILEPLVELAWIESGMPLRYSPVPFGNLIERVIEAETNKSHGRGITFAVSVQHPMPVVMGDPDRLYTAVFHLIDNALTYSDLNSLIAIHAWSDGQSAALSIADQGFGISPSDQELVFDRFFRSRDPRVQAIPGAGLGLTTARRIAQRHGGNIYVTSTIDKGSTFTLSLPAVDA